ncbi:MAG: phospholipase effector Tle1 domain-containing protein, partial [Gemmatimonadaceae bacterium]
MTKRRIVVCADGTWNTPDQKDGGKIAKTNVRKIHEAIDACPVASDGVQQISHYHEGVGAEPNWFEKTTSKIGSVLHIHALDHNLVAGITGEGIDNNIKDCYRWLVETYQDGDDIFLFGFSRGAYT